TLKIDTAKQFKKHKLFKVAKRLFALSKLMRDHYSGQLLSELLTSNVSKLSMINSNLKTLKLLLITILLNGGKIYIEIIYDMFQKIYEMLGNIIDVDINLDIIKARKETKNYQKKGDTVEQ